MVQALDTFLPNNDYLYCDLGSTVGTHIGPGAIDLFTYITKIKISRILSCGIFLFGCYFYDGHHYHNPSITFPLSLQNKMLFVTYIFVSSEFWVIFFCYTFSSKIIILNSKLYIYIIRRRDFYGQTEQTKQSCDYFNFKPRYFTRHHESFYFQCCYASTHDILQHRRCDRTMAVLWIYAGRRRYNTSSRIFGDRFGYKRTFNTVVSLALLLAVIGTFSWCIEALIVVRIFFGMTAGLLMPLTMAMLYQSVPVYQQAKSCWYLGNCQYCRRRTANLPDRYYHQLCQLAYAFRNYGANCSTAFILRHAFSPLLMSILKIPNWII